MVDSIAHTRASGAYYVHIPAAVMVNCRAQHIRLEPMRIPGSTGKGGGVSYRELSRGVQRVSGEIKTDPV